MRSGFDYETLGRRVDGLKRTSGEDAVVTIGYNTTVDRASPEKITAHYRGTPFAILTPLTVTVWHNKQSVTRDFKRQLNYLLGPVGYVIAHRGDSAYLVERDSGRFTPFDPGKPYVFRTHSKEEVNR